MKRPISRLIVHPNYWEWVKTYSFAFTAKFGVMGVVA
jgi:hypothetical protein